MSDYLIQIAGYLASLFLALSLIVTNDIKFRWLNTAGCIAFIIYGLLISAFPIILTNTILLGINLYALFKIYTRTEDFDLVEIGADDKLVSKFLLYYANDIQHYFPHFTLNETPARVRFIVLRDMAIANVFMALLDDNGRATIQLNYTVPRFRDYKVGRYIFEKEKNWLLAKGVKELFYHEVHNASHAEFITTMGFVTLPGNEKSYSKQL